MSELLPEGIKQMESMQYRRNRYVCHSCARHIVTIDRDDGTTPFMVKCENPECGGKMQSKFYSGQDSLEAPTHEWYRAPLDEVLIMSPSAKHHHEMGGLFLRKIRGRE